MSINETHSIHLRSSSGDKKNRRRLKPSLPKFQIPLKAHRNARNRVVWSPELHERFVLALRVVEENSCRLFPKAILEVMNVSGLSRENIASHLQKYRLASNPSKPSTPLSRSACALLSPMDVDGDGDANGDCDADADADADYDEQSESASTSPSNHAAREYSIADSSGYDSGEDDVPAHPAYSPPIVTVTSSPAPAQPTQTLLSHFGSSGSYPTAHHHAIGLLPSITELAAQEPGDESPITSPREVLLQQNTPPPTKGMPVAAPVQSNVFEVGSFAMELVDQKLFVQELEMNNPYQNDEEKWFFVGHGAHQTLQHEEYEFDVGY